MRKSTRLLYSFIFLTVVNILIFVFRNNFHYNTYSSYEDLYSECDRECVNKWYEFASPYPTNEQDAVKTLLNEDDNFNKARSDQEKVLAIGRLIYSQFALQSGTSTQSVNASPFSVFKNLQSCKQCKLWCGDFARMFTYFSLAVGIPSRYIQIEGQMGDHVVNEVYLTSRNRWVLVDLTNNFLMVSLGDTLFDLITFRESLLATKKLERIKVNSDGQIVTDEVNLSGASKEYYNTKNELHYYHFIDLRTAYSFTNRLKRYVLPVSWYEIYGLTRKSNVLHYVKLLCLSMWLVVLIAYVKEKIA